MKKILSLSQVLFLATTSFSSATFAQTKKTPQNDREKQIVAVFDQIKKRSKGALDLNVYQTPLGRVIVSPKNPATGKAYLLSGPPGKLLTVAFRNDDGQKLVTQGFYVGNRYGSNYFDLRNQFIETPQMAQQLQQMLTIEPQTYDYSGDSVSIGSSEKVRFEDAAKNFQLRHEDLKKNAQALSVAKSMAQHQMLESYYILNAPDSKLATSSKLRGVSDDADEIKYYRLFADYLAGYVQSDEDYLLQYEMQARSELVPGKKTISLSSLRYQVAQIYDNMVAEVDGGHFSKTEADRFRALRNSIHNGLKPSVIPSLQSFAQQNQGGLAAQLLTDIQSLIANIQAYYKLDAEIFTVLQKSISSDLPEIKNVITQYQLVSSGQKTTDLAALSGLADLSVKARQQFMISKNIDLIHFIIRSSQVLNQELAKIDQKDATTAQAKLMILVRFSYATGLLTAQQLSEIQANSNQMQAALTLIRSDLSQAIQKYNSIFQPSLEDWKLVSTSIFKFVEDGLRSTSLIQLDSQVNEMLGSTPAPVNTTPAAPAAPGNAPAPGAGNSVSSAGKYVVETEGVGYGYLRFIPAAQTESMTKQMTFKDIPIFESMPLDLGVVAGTITEQPQTPLSHVNMKSKDRKTPNMYLEKASKLPEIAKLINKLIKMELKDGKYSIKEVSLTEAEAAWSGQKKAIKKIDLRADLTEKRIRATAEMGFNDVVSVGAKAANYAEGTKILPGVFRDAFAIPFYYYEEFITTNTIADGNSMTLAQFILNLINDPKVQSDRNVLIQKLDQIQARMKSPAMKVNPKLIAQIQQMVSQKYPGQKMRFRSSTNSEDRPEFTGAGLYTSEGYNPKHDDPNYVDQDTGKPPVVRKTVENALKTVWASVWNLRAWDEREHYGIRHEQVKMAIAVTPGYRELANGVGVSKNTIKPELGPGVYLNIQEGEDAVTNPDPTITPDQVLVLFKPDGNKKYTLKYIQYSSKTKTKPVLEYAEVEKITDHLVTLHNHFKKLYNPNATGPVKFALDVEFKVDDIDANGKKDNVRRVYYKQARPFGG